MSQNTAIRILFFTISFFIFIAILLFILSPNHGWFYELCEERYSGTVYVYSGCQRVPFTETHCEYEGLVCDLKNGTKIRYNESIRSAE